MNCKPGDLAVIVRYEGWGSAGEISKLLVGRIVRVASLGVPSTPSICSASIVWKFEEPLKIEYEGKKYIADGIADFCLRPIRDDGDDAVDESSAWLPPVPTKETA